MADKNLADMIGAATRKRVPFWTPRRVWDSQKKEFVEVQPEFSPTDTKMFGSNAWPVVFQTIIALGIGYIALKLVTAFWPF